MQEFSLKRRSSESSISIVLRVFFVDVPNSVNVQILSASARTVFFCAFDSLDSLPRVAATVKCATSPALSRTSASVFSVFSSDVFFPPIEYETT